MERCIPMTIRSKAPEPRFARPGANPTLETIEYVQAALRAAPGPIREPASGRALGVGPFHDPTKPERRPRVPRGRGDRGGREQGSHLGPASGRSPPGSDPQAYEALMGLGAKDVVLSPAAVAALASLKSSSDAAHRAIAKRARGYRLVLLGDCLHGEVVKKDRILRVLRERYGLENLYVEDLPSLWRLLYTVVRDRGERYAVVVEVVDHIVYTRWFSRRR